LGTKRSQNVKTILLVLLMTEHDNADEDNNGYDGADFHKQAHQYVVRYNPTEGLGLCVNWNELVLQYGSNCLHLVTMPQSSTAREKLSQNAT